jgi:hypothetical protein
VKIKTKYEQCFCQLDWHHVSTHLGYSEAVQINTNRSIRILYVCNEHTNNQLKVKKIQRNLARYGILKHCICVGIKSYNTLSPSSSRKVVSCK